MKHTVLFTGHMIDAAERKEPRFPAIKESAAKAAIRKKLAEEKQTQGNNLTGISGGASGGDILFHELCGEMNIPSTVYLALPPAEYKKASVSFAGEGWDQRFEALMKKLPVHTLPETSGEESIWERTNLWMLHEALKGGGENMTLIALWNGKGGDGKGGTEHMVSVAKEKGAAIKIIDVNTL